MALVHNDDAIRRCVGWVAGVLLNRH